MNDGKKIFTNVIKGIAGGTLIAFGALSAIGFTQEELDNVYHEKVKNLYDTVDFSEFVAYL